MRAINPGYQYYLIPLTFVFTTVFAFINYSYVWKNHRKTIKVLIISAFLALIFYGIIPLYSDEAGFPIFGRSDYVGVVYTYLVSIPISIYLIRDQERYQLMVLSSQKKVV